MTARKKFLVRRENSSLWVSPWRGRWRFAWRETPSSPWRYTVRSTKADVEKAALERLALLASGDLDWHALPRERRAFLEAVHRAATPTEQAAILEFLAARRKSSSLPDAVARFLAWKNGGLPDSPHLAQVRRDLENLAEAFPSAILTDVQLPALECWWTARTGPAGPARKKAIRGNLVALWRWALRDGIAGSDPVTLAERLPAIDAGKGSLRIFELDELEHLLAVVEKPWFPLIVLGAFQGLRPEEIAPKTPKLGTAKPGMRWEFIDWEWNAIRIPAEVSKTGRARVLPFHPVTRAWLEAYGAGPTWTGRICLKATTEVTPRATSVWGKSLAATFPDRFPAGWPGDALRHSYASYRNAVVRNLPQVAEEMGTSEAMLHGHYHNPRTSAQGSAWFDFLPATAARLAPYLAAGVPTGTNSARVIGG